MPKKKPLVSNPPTEFDRVMMGLIHVSKKDLLAAEKRYKRKKDQPDTKPRRR